MLLIGSDMFLIGSGMFFLRMEMTLLGNYMFLPGNNMIHPEVLSTVGKLSTISILCGQTDSRKKHVFITKLEVVTSIPYCLFMVGSRVNTHVSHKGYNLPSVHDRLGAGSLLWARAQPAVQRQNLFLTRAQPVVQRQDDDVDDNDDDDDDDDVIT